MFTQWGPHGRALYGSAGQHQSTKHQAATSHQDQPLFRLIIRVAFTSLVQPPLPLYPTSWWPTRLGRPVLKCLGQHNQGPTITWSHTDTEHFDPVHRGAVRQRAGKIKCSKRQSPWKREVSIGACDWANWNQHPWLDTQAGALGSVSRANISHRLRCPAGSEGSLLRSGRGHMAVMSVQSEAS